MGREKEKVIYQDILDMQDLEVFFDECPRPAGVGKDVVNYRHYLDWGWWTIWDPSMAAAFLDARIPYVKIRSKGWPSKFIVPAWAVAVYKNSRYNGLLLSEERRILRECQKDLDKRFAHLSMIVLSGTGKVGDTVGHFVEESDGFMAADWALRHGVDPAPFWWEISVEKDRCSV